MGVVMRMSEFFLDPPLNAPHKSDLLLRKRFCRYIKIEGFQPRTPIRGSGGKISFLCGFH